MSTVDVEYNLCLVLQVLHRLQPLRSLFGNAPDVRRHIQKVAHLLRLTEFKGELQRPAVEKPKARKLRMQMLFLLPDLRIDQLLSRGR